jgi:hypothetical protein
MHIPKTSKETFDIKLLTVDTLPKMFVPLVQTLTSQTYFQHNHSQVKLHFLELNSNSVNVFHCRAGNTQKCAQNDRKDLFYCTILGNKRSIKLIMKCNLYTLLIIHNVSQCTITLKFPSFSQISSIKQNPEDVLLAGKY